MNRIKKIENEFEIYMKNFNMYDLKIKFKYDHSINTYKLYNEYSNIDNYLYELASISILLHDIGRFQQITTFNTFVDARSIDHGQLGYDILYSDLFHISEYFSKREWNIITMSILYHNKLSFDTQDYEAYTIWRNIQDFDKADNIMLSAKNIKNTQATINQLKREKKPNEYIYQCYINKENVDLKIKMYESKNDFILYILTWYEKIHNVKLKKELLQSINILKKYLYDNMDIKKYPI